MTIPKRRTIFRFFLLSALLVGTLWAAESIPPLFDGRLTPPPDPTGARVRDLLLRADKAGATEYAKGKRLQADADLSAALREVNGQFAQPFYSRNFTRAASLLEAASAAALGLHAEVKASSDRDRLDTIKILAEVDDHLAGARALAGHTSGDAYVRQRLTRAEICARDAKTLLASGRYRSAATAARESLAAARVSSQRSLGLLSRFSDPANVARWRQWLREAQDESQRSGIALVVVKEHHRLDIYKGGKVIRSMQVDLGANSLKQKLHAGDRATPEGRYRITVKKNHGQSKYGQALLLNYPNEEDRARFTNAKSRNQIARRTGIGGLIEIHGQGGRGEDWTDGCVAPEDREMSWLFNQVRVGTMVVIVGSDGARGPIQSALQSARGLQ